eukprot:6003092-Amphidinium_carterae.1
MESAVRYCASAVTAPHPSLQAFVPRKPASKATSTQMPACHPLLTFADCYTTDATYSSSAQAYVTFSVYHQSSAQCKMTCKATEQHIFLSLCKWEVTSTICMLSRPNQPWKRLPPKKRPPKQ